MPRSEHDPAQPSSVPRSATSPSGAPDAPSTPFPGEDAVLYRERLWPPFWVWFVCIGVVAGLLVVFAPINMTAGVVVFVILAALVVFALARSAATIVVTPTVLQVGRAQIERRYLGEVAGFSGEDARIQRGMELNARAYQCIRGWVDPVVTVQIIDANDPTPYWITSTRHPQQLAEALTSVPHPAA
ncbi:DUF3093 domain-containing protein [Tersicoccus phoenicis]|uniref:DUF3093 domain-containing protein n=1 Tax=Tersicoccus phoenicis TaxID=554083 RepID=UPI000A042B56|nr:DUF3093 domain-containing protein [Tersicoccus phoenicis]